jgi:mRNA-degrading endonuclease RelE of RelBE toxin-antitoxin system
MRELLITPQFRKDSNRIPDDILEQADLVLLKLRKNPLDDTLDIKKLKIFKPVIWRVRIGAYRLVYSFNGKFIVCLRFRHRKDIYRNL